MIIYTCSIICSKVGLHRPIHQVVDIKTAENFEQPFLRLHHPSVIYRDDNLLSHLRIPTHLSPSILVTSFPRFTALITQLHITRMHVLSVGIVTLFVHRSSSPVET